MTMTPGRIAVHQSRHSTEEEEETEDAGETRVTMTRRMSGQMIRMTEMI